MSTNFQFFRKINKKKKQLSKTSRLFNRSDRRISCPQLIGIVTHLRIITPKKPNSARRQCVKVVLTNKKPTLAYIPGSGHNLRKFSKTLIRGGGARDLPGVSYSCCRGPYGLNGILNKSRRRSIYGAKRPDILKKKLRRKFRKIFQ
uniref:ribosomal protein S12 n=1 Tax=Cryptocaryon irritans TaxID=153251 RepID=UPI0022FD7301|nr:ribosomal protein S12 [Cryptocaryon irritans]WBP62318.1 ribosomal protein S12 [Cryptocaryon irritans]